MSERKERIKAILESKLNPTSLKIRDDSALHANHGNVNKGDKETHLHIYLVSPIFKGKNKVK